jgi:hypothetical protein
MQPIAPPTRQDCNSARHQPPKKASTTTNLLASPSIEHKNLVLLLLRLKISSDFIILPHEFDLAKQKLESRKNFTFIKLEGVDHFMSDQKDKMASLQTMRKIAQTKTPPPLSPKLTSAPQN